MRPRLAPSLLLVAALLAAALAVGNSPTSAGTAPPQQQGAGLEDIVRSLVSGENPLIREATDQDAFSPYGAPATDDTGQATITGTFHAEVNLGGPQSFGAVDTVEAWETLRDWVRGSPDSLGGAYMRTDLGIPAYGPAVDGFEAGPSMWETEGIVSGTTEVQTLFGQDVVVVAPPSGVLPTMGHQHVWGSWLGGELPLMGGCGGQTHEIGIALHRDGFPRWSSPAAVYDLFGNASHAIVGSCNNNAWGLQGFENQGDSFSNWTTETTLLIFKDTVIGITNGMDMAGLTGHRPFAFRTPAIGGGQPENTIATSSPHVPEMGESSRTVLVGQPFGTGITPTPFELQHTLVGGPSSSCVASWSALYEAYFAPSSDPTQSVNLQLYQFHSGQVSIGSAVLVAGGAAMTTTGSGEGYTESYAIDVLPAAATAAGQYVYMPSGVTCSYESSVVSGTAATELVDAITQQIAEIPPPDEEPIDDGSSDGPGIVEDTGDPDSGTEAEPATDPVESPGQGDSPLWPIVAIITGLVAVIGGWFVSRTREEGDPATPAPTTPPITGSTTTAAGTSAAGTSVGAIAGGPCDRLRRLHAAAQAEAEAKRKAATEAAEAATAADKAEADAREAAKEAEKKASDTKRDRDRAERDRDRPPANEDDTWMEDSTTGERITLRDLRLRREAAGDAWDRYQDDPSQESAEQTQEDWNDLDADGARDGRRTADEADQGRRQADLDAAENAHGQAEEARTQADQAVTNASEAAKDARRDADAAEADATAAEARAATLKRQLEECLGMPSSGSGTGTRWGGPMGLSEDCDGGCFPEGNVERRVLETFGTKDVKVNYWVTVRPDSNAREDAQTIAGELRWWRDAFATTSAAINVGGALKGLVTRTTGDAASTAASGASVIGGEALGIDIPTNIYQVPVVVLEGAAAASAVIIDKFGEWIQKNHVEWIAEWGYQVRTCTLAWVEIWKCENGVKRCVERVLEVDMSPPRMTGVVKTETYQPNENWHPRVNGLTNTHARIVKNDSQALMDFMAKHTVGPCG